MTDPIEIAPFGDANIFFRVMRQLAGVRPVSWLFARVLPPLDRLVSRLSGGRFTLAGILTGLQVLELISTGAKSGVERTQPLLFLREGKDFVVIASNWGQSNNPAWYYNLRANPDAKVGFNGKTYIVRAEEVADAALCARYWEQACRMYPAWQEYKKRTPRASFPVMRLRVAA